MKLSQKDILDFLYKGINNPNGTLTEKYKNEH